MGYIRHHAIVVTGTYGDWAASAHEKAREIFNAYNPTGRGNEYFVSPLTESGVNGTMSFCVFPDGSKEGWEESHQGDNARESLVEWLRAQCYDDGSSPLAWVEVQYGDDNLETKIVNDSDEAQRDATDHEPQMRLGE